ncbi:slightly ste11-like protein [Apiospora hydei]|uniref:Slightly ste11-like protein n=1 Tax=Apiospora hydei TaxID=1337664 RepID=A0ABR1VI21_9PEZI
MADHWIQPTASAAAGQQQNNPRTLQTMWNSLEQQLSLLCQVITLDTGLYESWEPMAREFFKQKMEARYSCEAFYLADSGNPGRVFLAPVTALAAAQVSICATRHDQLPILVEGGASLASSAGNQQPAQEQPLVTEAMQQVINQSVQQAVQQAMQQSLQHLSLSPQKSTNNYDSPNTQDGSPKKRKLELSPVKKKVATPPTMPESAPGGSTGYRAEDDDGYSEAGSFINTGSKYRKKEYASGGPRPVNSFMLYRKHVHGEVTAQNPGVKNSEISKIIGQQWRNLPEEEKAIWRVRQEQAAAQHAILYPNYRYTPKSKYEKDEDTPSKSKSQSSLKKQQGQATPRSSYQLPPSPPWHKTSFGDDVKLQEIDPIDPELDQMASTGPTESFFDQAMTAEVAADHPASTGTPDGTGEAVKGANKDLANVTHDDSTNVAANNVEIYNEPSTFDIGFDGVDSGFFEMGDWNFDNTIDIDAAMRDFDFSLST